MSRRQVNPLRRFTDREDGRASSLQSKARAASPVLLIGLTITVGLAIAKKLEEDQLKGADFRGNGDFSCTMDVPHAVPFLKKAYGDSMHKVLHVGPDSCSLVSELLNGEDTEAWGLEPYDIEDADNNCRSLVRKGIVRVADIKFALPYRAKSFSLVIVSDALDYLSPKYLNKTLPDLAKISADGLVIFTGYVGHQKAKDADISKFGRPAKRRSSSWWIRFFVQMSLEENEAAIKKFEQAATKRSYKPGCQIFHLKSYQ